MRIVFMGTPDFSIPALEALHHSSHEILAVLSQPARMAGRGQKLRHSPVARKAEMYNIPVHTPKTLRNSGNETVKHLRALKPDAIVVVAYGLLLPKDVLDICPCYNIHASLLPRWRGAAPIQRSLLAGDEETGITIMHMNEGMDTGDMLLGASLPILADSTTESLHDALSLLGAKLILNVLDLHKNKAINPQKQDDALATHAPKITKEEARIDWTQTLAQLSHHIRAFYPSPGAYFYLGDERIKLLSADYVEAEHTHHSGTVTDNDATIAVEGGFIKPLILQREGKSAMPAEAVLRGFKFPKDEKLS